MIFDTIPEFHPAGLSWNQPPMASAKEGEVIPEFSIKSSPGVKTMVKLTGEPGDVFFKLFSTLFQFDS